MNLTPKFLIAGMCLFLFAAPLIGVAAIGSSTTSSTPVTGSSTPSTAEPIPNLPINTNLPIPNAVPISGDGGQGPAALVANMYSFAFLLAGVLAFAMIVYGGVRWTFSGGNASATKDAKDAITQALLGLGLLFFAYLILRTINPDLTNLRLPELPAYVPPEPVALGPGSPPVNNVEGQPPTDDPNCSYSVERIKPDAWNFERGEKVTFQAGRTDIDRNLDLLEEQVEKAQDLVQRRSRSASLTVNSAYRPISYQEHLYQVWIADKTFRNDPGLAANCPKLKAWVDAEMQEHILVGSTVSRPSACSPHVRGVAVDITFSGLDDNRIEAHRIADELFRENNVDIRWKRILGDEAHYELCTRPYTPSGCSNNLPRSC